MPSLIFTRCAVSPSCCYGIVKKLGGEISVNSAVGLGTTFHVRIPHTAKQPEAET
jgi:signal transduction histidine kinase